MRLLAKLGDRDAQKRNRALLWMLGEQFGDKIDRRLSQHGGGRNGRGKGEGARNRSQIRKPHAHRDGASGTRFIPKAAADAFGEVMQHRAKHRLARRLPAKGGLGAGRLSPAMSLKFARILIPGERSELLANSPAKNSLDGSR